MIKRSLLFSVLLLFAVLVVSCKKELQHAPELQFKTGSGYTAADATANTNESIQVGVICSKTDIDLHMFYVDVAYDGASGTTNKYRYYVQPGEFEHLEKTYTFVTRSTPGNERWVFSINDRDGHITTKEINLQVQ